MNELYQHLRRWPTNEPLHFRYEINLFRPQRGAQGIKSHPALRHSHMRPDSLRFWQNARKTQLPWLLSEMRETKRVHETQECWCTHTFMIGGQKRRSGVRRRRAITHWRWRSDCGKGTRAEAGRPSWGPPLGFCSFPFRSLRSLWSTPWHCPRGGS